MSGVFQNENYFSSKKDTRKHLGSAETALGPNLDEKLKRDSSSKQEKRFISSFGSPLSLGPAKAPKPKYEICRPMKIGGDIDDLPQAPIKEEFESKNRKRVEDSWIHNFISFSESDEDVRSEGKSCDTFIFIQPKIHPEDYSDLSL